MSQLRILVTGCKGRMGHAVTQSVERDPDCLVCGDALRNDLSGEAHESISLDALMNATGITLEGNAEEENE